MFTFGTKIADRAAYNVTVKIQQTDQTCTAGSNTGAIARTNVTNVSIVCAATKRTGTKQLGISSFLTHENDLINTFGKF